MKLSTNLGLLASVAATWARGASATEAAPTPTVGAHAAAAPFAHPGIFVDAGGLQLAASKVAAGEQPWASAYSALKAHPYATRTSPTPFATVECGPTSTPDVGCGDERADSMSAYANALMWAVSKDQARADRAIAFMNAWARTIKAHTLSNAPLQAAWAAANWVRAAEIIRHTNAGWRSGDIAAFEGMLRSVYLPLVRKGSKNPNNWELMFNEATVGIAVFLDDRPMYDATIRRFIRSTSQYIYLKSDGPRPVKPAGYSDARLDQLWKGQIARGLDNGIAMEVCRDLTHTGYGIASVSHVAETSRIQGRDLYAEEVGTRLRYALGFHTKYDPKGGAVAAPRWLCDGQLRLHLEDVTEPGWNALGTSFAMPYTGNFTLRHRPARANSLFIGWETLTHAR